MCIYILSNWYETTVWRTTIEPRIKKNKRFFLFNFGFVGEIENAYLYIPPAIYIAAVTLSVFVFTIERKKNSHTHYTGTNKYNIKLVHDTLILSEL